MIRLAGYDIQPNDKHYLAIYQRALTEIWDELPNDEREAYQAQVKEWQKEGLPDDMKAKNLATKTEDFVRVFAQEAWKQLGIRVLVHGSWKGADGRTMVAEYVASSLILRGMLRCPRPRTASTSTTKSLRTTLGRSVGQGSSTGYPPTSVNALASCTRFGVRRSSVSILSALCTFTHTLNGHVDDDAADDEDEAEHVRTQSCQVNIQWSHDPDGYPLLPDKNDDGFSTLRKTKTTIRAFVGETYRKFHVLRYDCVLNMLQGSTQSCPEPGYLGHPLRKTDHCILQTSISLTASPCVTPSTCKRTRSSASCAGGGIVRQIHGSAPCYVSMHGKAAQARPRHLGQMVQQTEGRKCGDVGGPSRVLVQQTTLSTEVGPIPHSTGQIHRPVMLMNVS